MGIDGSRRNLSNAGRSRIVCSSSRLPRCEKVERRVWRYGHETGAGEPDHGHAPRARQVELDPFRELPYGPAACDSCIRGRTHVSTRPAAQAKAKFSLTSNGASTHVASRSPGHRRKAGRLRARAPAKPALLRRETINRRSARLSRMGGGRSSRHGRTDE